ncbi:MAG: hypothetical protein KUG64_10780 [Cycloclasticus sp.]|nr:hypothetical protein [Cycloclasticus sp.]
MTKEQMIINLDREDVLRKRIALITAEISKGINEGALTLGCITDIAAKGMRDDYELGLLLAEQDNNVSLTREAKKGRKAA